MWKKKSDVKTQTKYLNIAKVALRRIKKYYGRKAKNISKEEKQKYKAYFEGETCIFIIEKLTRDIIERCRVPEAIELRKKCLIKNLITENQIFGLKITILLLKLMNETMKIMTQMMKKK